MFLREIYHHEETVRDRVKRGTVARHWGGSTGNRPPPEIAAILQKRVKTSVNGHQYINQRAGENWDQFYNMIRNYWISQRVQSVS